MKTEMGYRDLSLVLRNVVNCYTVGSSKMDKITKSYNRANDIIVKGLQNKLYAMKSDCDYVAYLDCFYNVAMSSEDCNLSDIIDIVDKTFIQA